MVLHSFDESVLWSKELMNSRHFFSLLLRIDIWIRLFSSLIFGECGSWALSSSLSVIHSLGSSESWEITSLRLPDGMWCLDAVFMTFRSTASPWYTSVGPDWFLSALSISCWKAGQSDLAMLMKVRLGALMGSRNDEDEMDSMISKGSNHSAFSWWTQDEGCSSVEIEVQRSNAGRSSLLQEEERPQLARVLVQTLMRFTFRIYWQVLYLSGVSPSPEKSPQNTTLCTTNS